MEMELYQELILTAVISLLVAFLLSRLAAVSPVSSAAAEPAAEPAAAVTRPVRIGGKRVRFRDPIGESRSDPTDSGGLVAAAAAAARADSVAEIASEAGLEGESVTESAAETVESSVSSIRDSDFDAEVKEAGLERESVIGFTDPAENRETEANTVKLMLESENRDQDVAQANEARMESSTNLEVESHVIEAILKGETMMELPETIEIQRGSVEIVELPGSSTTTSKLDFEVESQVIEATLEGKTVMELPETMEIQRGSAEIVELPGSSTTTSKLDFEVESQVIEAILEGETVMELPETMEIQRGSAEIVELPAVSDSDLEVESKAIEAMLEGEPVIELSETMEIERGSAEIVELPAVFESDLEVESQVIEAILEGKPVMELPEIVKIDNVSVGVASATESRTVASESQDEDAAEVNGAGLEEELVIEMPEVEKFDVESVKDGAQGEMVELSGGKSDIVRSPEGTSVEKKGFKDVIGGGQESGDGEASEVKLEEESLIEVPETVEVSKLAESVTQLAEEKIVQSPGAEVEIVRSLEESGEQETIGGGERLGSLLQGEDEWEGIERSEPEKLFAVAASYTSSAVGSEAVSRLGSDVQMELYALHKVATEGPCYEPQPMALMISSRAKWHAWQKLGNMDPEVAMEHYLSLLTRSIPGWMGVKPGEETSSLMRDTKPEEVNEPQEQGVIETATANLGASLDDQLSSITGRESQDHIEADSSSDDPALSGQGSR